MYKSSNPSGTHLYAVYKDKKTKRTRAIQLTHVLEKKKERQINRGVLSIEKIKPIKHISGVPNKYYDSDVNGKPLQIGKKNKRKSDMKYIGTVPTSQAKRIQKFAKIRHK